VAEGHLLEPESGGRHRRVIHQLGPGADARSARDGPDRGAERSGHPDHLLEAGQARDDPRHLGASLVVPAAVAVAVHAEQGLGRQLAEPIADPAAAEIGGAASPDGADVVFTVDATAATGHPALSSEEIADLAAEHADVLIPFGSVIRSAGEAVRQARRLVTEHGVRGFKFHPSLQGFEPNDRRYYPLYEELEEARRSRALPHRADRDRRGAARRPRDQAALLGARCCSMTWPRTSRS
jgi:predicted TIM-barrel fold metal-dependent hydrolase